MKNFTAAISIFVFAAMGCGETSVTETKQEAYISDAPKVQFIKFTEPLYIEGKVQHLDFTGEPPLIIVVELKGKE